MSQLNNFTLLIFYAVSMNGPYQKREGVSFQKGRGVSCAGKAAYKNHMQKQKQIITGDTDSDDVTLTQHSLNRINEY